MSVFITDLYYGSIDMRPYCDGRLRTGVIELLRKKLELIERRRRYTGVPT